MLVRVLLLFLTAALAGCASQAGIAYKGPDAGRVVVGIGATNDTSYSFYMLKYRQAGSPSKKALSGNFTFFQTNLFAPRPPDYENAKESGVVIVDSLPPGRYEVFDYSIYQNTGTMERTYSSREPFSIPFEVKPGVTTYLGNYRAKAITGKNVFGITVDGGANFLVSDSSERDLGIAHSRGVSKEDQVLNMTPSASAIGNPAFLEGMAAPLAR